MKLGCSLLFWLLSLKIVLLKFTHVTISLVCSLLLLCTIIPLYEYATIYLFIPFLVLIWLFFPHFGAVFAKAAVHIFERAFWWTYALILLGIYLGVELLGHKTSVCLVLRDTGKIEALYTPQVSISLQGYLGRLLHICREDMLISGRLQHCL